MNDSKLDSGEPEAFRKGDSWTPSAILVAACVLVIGVYAYAARSNVLPSGSLRSADNYYNLLVQGFRAGQLSLKMEVPTGFTHLADPYDPEANRLFRFAPYGMLDMSYYKGRLYLYFGVTPAVLLFWPYNALTGHYLSYGQAGVVFYALGFLAAAYVLFDLWRRYFSSVSVWVAAVGTLVLGWASGVPIILVRCKVNDVAIGCGYALTMVALAAIWNALHVPRQRLGWLALASLAYGLAVGARPSLLFGAVIVLAPAVQAWRERQRIWAPLAAAVGPMALIGVGLMAYNLVRFDSPFEFGWHYQLSPGRQITQPAFGLQYLWFDFRAYFLKPARWVGRVPFVRDIAVPPLPPAYGMVEHPFGVLTTFPIVWLSLAAPVAWRDRSKQARRDLRWFVAVVALLFAITALTVDLFWSAIIRYEVEFLPALVLLAVIGILSLERVVLNRPGWQRAVRWSWICLAAFSVAFNAFASIKVFAETCNDLGIALARGGQVAEAIGRYEQALRLNPDYAEADYNLGVALARTGQMPKAMELWEQALRIKPDLADAHNNLGVALMGLGRTDEAIRHYEQALRISSNNAETHNNLGNALVKLGRLPEAIGEYEQALRLRPDFTEAQHALARARAAP